MRFKGKKVLVVGLGKSGQAAVRFFLESQARVAVTDCKGEEELQPLLREWEGLPVETYLGQHLPVAFEGRDLICPSPGVPLDLPPLVRARRRRVPIIGELGIAVLHLEDPIIAVTGTNGKSTTATLIARMLEAAGHRTALAGNIGKPLLEIVLEKARYDWIVAEVSSFQLETVQAFRPRISVLLNVTPDHLDRYSTFRDYVRAKARILKDQTVRDWVVYNQEDPSLMPFVRRSHPKRVPFSLRRQSSSGVFYLDGRIVRKGPGLFENYSLDRVRLLGPHNIENMMAAIAAARICDVSPAVLRTTLETFKGLPHRLEFVRESQGVRYYDDSKGTNVDAVVRSLASFQDGRVLLIAGGRDKGGSYAPLKEVLSKKVRVLFLIGEAAPKMEKALRGVVPIRQLGTLERAMAEAGGEARGGDTVLLSPACSSFDQFRDYAERGKRFQELVNQL